MKFKTTKNKFRVIHEKNQTNLNNLDKKLNKWKKDYKEGKIVKAPQTIYDSGWVAVGADSSNIVSGNVRITNSEYSDKRGDVLPLLLIYGFYQELTIPKKYLSYLKPVIMVKKPNDMTIASIYDYKWNKWDNDEYFDIQGDSTIIFRGYNAYKTIFPASELINESISLTHASKWYSGYLKWVTGGDSYELKNSYVVSVKTYYNFHPDGEGGENYDIFECPAIDFLSSSSITGTGTHTTRRLVAGIETFTTTKNVTKTAPLFIKTTNITASGNLYKNNAYQGNYSLISPYTISFLNPFGGNIPLGEWGYISHLENEEQTYRLWWSNKRAEWFLFNTSTYDFITVPTVNDYESATLPYTKIYVDVNPDPYPVLEEQTDIEYAERYKPTFSKISEKNATEEKYVLTMSGRILLLAPATEDIGTTIEYAKDVYSISGNTYNKTSSDRTPKEVSRFVPETQNVFFRYKLVITNPLYFHEIKKDKKSEYYEI